MRDFLRGFRRNADGSWTCVSRAAYSGTDGNILVTPGTTFSPGTRILGVDLVAWLEMLDREHARHRQTCAAEVVRAI